MTNHNTIENCNITIGLLNARSMLTRNSDINEPIAIHELVIDKKYDLLAITETWLRTKGDEASIAEFILTNYAFIHLFCSITSKTVRGGGVGLMYRNDLFRIKKWLSCVI